MPIYMQTIKEVINENMTNRILYTIFFQVTP